MDRIVAFNAMYAAVDFDALSLTGWVFVVFAGHPSVLRWLHAGLTVACIGLCVAPSTAPELTSTLPIAIALATKWAYPPPLPPPPTEQKS